MHPCTNAEFDKFYEPSKAYTDRFKGLRKSGSMMCIDWVEADLPIYGTESSGNFGSLDVMAVPCHMGQEIEETENDIGVFVQPPSSCNTNLDDAQLYIKNIRIVVIYNEGRFQQDQYG